MIECQDVSFSYPASTLPDSERQAGGALKHISCTIEDGSFVLLCGTSGCGKTTMTRLFNGLIPHYHEGTYTGSVYLDGKDTRDLSLFDISLKVGSVFQNPRSQFFNVDTTSELAFGPENHGIAEDLVRDRVKRVAAQLKLEPLLDRSIFSLSGGEKQKIACGSAAAIDPDVYVLDEPSSNLDAYAIADFRQLLFTLKSQGKTIIISEHRLYYLSGLFDRVLYLKDGEIEGDYTAEEFCGLSAKQRDDMGLRPLNLAGLSEIEGPPQRMNEAVWTMVAEKRIHIGDRLRYIPMGYFNKNSIGNITAIVTTTLGDVENSAARVLVSVLGGFFNSVALVIVLLVFDWRIGLVAAAGVLIYLAAAELALRKSAALSGVRQHTQESLVESVLEYIQGMGIVKAFGLERDSTQSIGSAIKASCRDNLKLTKASVPYDAIKQAVVRVFSVLLLLASVWFWLDGSLPLAYGLILVIASFMVFNDLENAGNMASLLQMLAASMDTANSIDDTPVMDEKGADITPKSSEIVFNKVDFSYADRKILDQVSFTIPEKTTTAIVGPSGAGKTTMCNLIARFWDVNAGKITIGGTDVRDFKLDSLMKNISMVFQSVYLFADTIENNIKFGCPDATHEQVVEAAKKACCHDFISALPDGYDTVIGEGGGTLSGGEKQRISIARAMLKDAPIIILDEATSSVDPENEDELQRAIEALTHDKTIIMIAHRLKTVRNADQILVLDNAHIVQRGTHAELIQQKGLYADFVSARQEAIGWKLAQ